MFNYSIRKSKGKFQTTNRYTSEAAQQICTASIHICIPVQLDGDFTIVTWHWPYNTETKHRDHVGPYGVLYYARIVTLLS